MEVNSVLSTHPFRSVLDDADELGRITVNDFFQYRRIAGTQEFGTEIYQFLQSQRILKKIHLFSEHDSRM
jgi:hypothetical protein